jgi:hypothetical protein
LREKAKTAGFVLFLCVRSYLAYDHVSCQTASITPAQWRCLREQEGFSFAIIEAWNGGFQLNQKRTLSPCLET